MSRPYSMANRLTKVQDLQRRIVDAAMALHAERGIQGTKPADIAARANVALATYYKYFPSSGMLVQACTTRGRELLPPPDPRTINVGARDLAGRIAAMVRGLFDYYQTRELLLYTGRTEERFIPELQPVLAGQRAARDACVQTALADTATSRETAAMATALVDFWTWRTLRRDAGLTQEEVIHTVATTLERVIGRQ